MTDKIRSVNSLTRESVRRRDGRKCIKCHGTKKLEIHHINPKANGGIDRMENLITLCAECHKEWHRYFETDFEFAVWLTIPPAPEVVKFLFRGQTNCLDSVRQKLLKEKRP